MTKFSYIERNLNKYFSLKEVASALKTTRTSVQRWCKQGYLKYESGKVKSWSGYQIKGEWLIDYLDKLNGLKSVGEILLNYKLPNERE